MVNSIELKRAKRHNISEVQEAESKERIYVVFMPSLSAVMRARSATESNAKYSSRSIV